MNKAEATGSCPQCGAPVELDIGDPLLSCGFCRTKLYMVPPGGIFSYFLSPATKPRTEQEVCFLPYWRFRGFKFRVHEHKPTDCSLVDTTIPAVEMFSGLPLLGMAPQLGAVRLNPERPPGLSLLNNPSRALKRADAMIERLLKDKPVLEGIMGENSSLILAPFEIRRGQGNRTFLKPLWGPKGTIPLGQEQEEAIEQFMEPAGGKEKIRFLPLICPECGADLPAFPRAKALLCRVCGRIWGLGSSRLFPKRFSMADGPVDHDMIFLPFWHFNLEIEGLGIDSRYSLFRQLFPYRDAPESWKTEPVGVVIPAFKINPRLFFRLSTRMSSTSTEFPRGASETSQEVPKLHMVNFTLEEAAKSIRIVLLDIFKNRKKIRDQLLKSPVRVKGSQLVLLPFRKGIREYVAVHSGQAVPIAAIELGTRL